MHLTVKQCFLTTSQVCKRLFCIQVGDYIDISKGPMVGSSKFIGKHFDFASAFYRIPTILKSSFQFRVNSMYMNSKHTYQGRRCTIPVAHKIFQNGVPMYRFQVDIFMYIYKVQSVYTQVGRYTLDLGQQSISLFSFSEGDLYSLHD